MFISSADSVETKMENSNFTISFHIDKKIRCKKKWFPSNISSNKDQAGLRNVFRSWYSISRNKRYPI